MNGRCGYVTGRSDARHLRDLPEERRGLQRGTTDVYDVLCGAPAPYLVRAASCEPGDGCEERRACGRDLAAVIDLFPEDVTVQRRGFTERRRPVTHFVNAILTSSCGLTRQEQEGRRDGRTQQLGSVDCPLCLTAAGVTPS